MAYVLQKSGTDLSHEGTVLGQRRILDTGNSDWTYWAIEIPADDYPTPTEDGKFFIALVVYKENISGSMKVGMGTDNVVLNRVPTIDTLPDRAINEDAGEQTVRLAGIACGDSNWSQAIRVSATGSDTGLIPHPTVTYTSPPPCPSTSEIARPPLNTILYVVGLPRKSAEAVCQR